MKQDKFIIDFEDEAKFISAFGWTNAAILATAERIRAGKNQEIQAIWLANDEGRAIRLIKENCWLILNK